MAVFRNADSPGVRNGVRAAEQDDVLIFPASLAQSRYWALDCLTPGNSTYSIPVRFRLQGPLDTSLVERACNEIVRRHEVLRTTFAIVDGQLAQVVAPSVVVGAPVKDLRHLPKPERDAELDRICVEEAHHRFDLKVGPLFRARLIRSDEEEHVLLVAVHHSVADYWSIGLISNELGALYEGFERGNDSPLPGLPIQYADFTIWQREWIESQPHAEKLAYWTKQLKGLRPLEFPTDHPRGASPTFNSTITSVLLPKSLTDAVRNVSIREGTTFFNIMLAAFKLLLYRYTGQGEIIVGTQIACRDRVELENLIGCFINTLVLRTDLSGDPVFPELLGRVRHMMLQAVLHQEGRFERLLETFGHKDNPSTQRLFRVNFICQRDPVRPLEFSGIKLTVMPSKSQGALYDLNCFLVERAEGWRLACEYNTDLFEAASISRMFQNYTLLLQSIAENPDRRLSEFPALEGTNVVLVSEATTPADRSEAPRRLM